MSCTTLWLLPVAILSLLLAGCTLTAARQPLAARIEAVINQPQFAQAHWGLLIVDQTSGQVLYEHEADKLFAPASCTKLFTLATAMDAFGPDRQFATTIYRRGDINAAGELAGDLILVAGGDLTLGGRTDKAGHIAFTNVDHTYANDYTLHELTAPDPLAGLNELARQVAAAGVKHVRGDVLIDDRLFDAAEGSGSGPSKLTPIMVNDNVIDFLITPAKTGAAATVQSRPKTAAIDVDAQVETAAAGTAASIDIATPAPGKITVRGRIPEGAKPLVRVKEVEDSNAFARALLIEALARAGVTADVSARSPMRGQLPERGTYQDAQRIALLKSPPFAEEAKLVMKVSHNLHAGAIPLLVAVNHGGRTLADGLHVQHDFLKRVGVDVETISFAGGGGGARADYATPRTTVQLLRYMTTRSDFAAYHDALPLLGVDGTLATAVGPDSPARGKVSAKSGTLIWENTMNGNFLITSKALAGYMQTATGQKLAFAIFVNNVMVPGEQDGANVGATLGRLCEIVYEN